MQLLVMRALRQCKLSETQPRGQGAGATSHGMGVWEVTYPGSKAGAEESEISRRVDVEVLATGSPPCAICGPRDTAPVPKRGYRVHLLHRWSPMLHSPVNIISLTLLCSLEDKEHLCTGTGDLYLPAPDRVTLAIRMTSFINLIGNNLHLGLSKSFPKFT